MGNILQTAFVQSASGSALTNVHEFKTDCWDELSDWANKLFAPSRVVYTGKAAEMRAQANAIHLGRMVISRASYGTAINAFNEEGGLRHTVVSTTLVGSAQHTCDSGRLSAVARPGEAIILRGSTTSQTADLSHDCVRLNVSIAPDLMNDVCQEWFGRPLDDYKMPAMMKINGQETGWLTLLKYVLHQIGEAPDQWTLDRLGRLLKHTVCSHILIEMFNHAGRDLGAGASSIAPRIVRQAEAYMIEHVADAPSLVEVAKAAECSVRNLTQTFKSFRGYTVNQFMTEQRLTAIRRELLSCGGDRTISEIARSYGYIHMGEFAKRYKNRFDELPSDTIKS